MLTNWEGISLDFKQDVVFRSLSQFESQATLFKISADGSFNPSVFGFLKGLVWFIDMVWL